MKIVYFARLREAFGESEEMDLDGEKGVSEIVDILKARGPEWASELSRPFRVAVNRKMAGMDARVADSDELAVFPPVTGG